MVGRVLPIVAIVLAVTACGDHPVPAHGHITKRYHNDEYWYYVPGTTNCSGNPVICTTTPGYTNYVPEEWVIGVTDFRNGGWYGEVHVEPDVYDECQVDQSWPECWGGHVQAGAAS